MNSFGKHRGSADFEQTLTLASLTSLPQVDSAEALLASQQDAIWFPDGVPATPSDRWLDPYKAPYILVLHNSVFYPNRSLAKPQDAGRPVGKMARNALSGLLLREDGSILPDGLGKSMFLPPCIEAHDAAGPWTAHLPQNIQSLQGTHLFCEHYFGHFGHSLVDMSSRLWPLNNQFLSASQFDGAIAQGLMGVSPDGQKFPQHSRLLLDAYGVPEGKQGVAQRPVRIEKLVVPRRIAPFKGLMHPHFGKMMRKAGQRLSAGENHDDLPRRIWLSRSKLTKNIREGAGVSRLDTLAQDRGFTVLHPQEMPLSRQVAHARAATHIAGPVGSQLHLCGFSEMPGLKIMSVGPSYFQLDINSKMIADLGGEEHSYILNLPRPTHVPRHRAIWDFAQEHEAGLHEALDAFL